MKRVKGNRWNIIEDEFKQEYLQDYESLFTLGNGYLGIRGSLEEEYQESKPGFFIAGTFDKYPGEVTELPNVANGLALEIELGEERFDLTTGEIIDYQRRLDLKNGTLKREVKWESPAGKIIKLNFSRFVSFKNQHLIATKLSLSSDNYFGTVKITSTIDGQETNSGTQHFIDQEKCSAGESGMYIIQKTQQSGLEIAQAAFHKLKEGEQEIELEADYWLEKRRINYTLEFELKEGKSYDFEKIIGVYTTREVKGPKEEAIKTAQLGLEAGYEDLLAKHTKYWAKQWERSDIKLDGPKFDQLATRFAIFHLLQMTHKEDDTVSVGAKALSGEGYKGHVFWDTEIFILPFFIYNYPKAAKTLLTYRYNTLDGARKKAADNGYQGAQFAWESARSGEETTPKWGGLDIETKEPIKILCGEIEEHITVDVAYAIWHYYKATCDKEFFYNYGTEILLETSRFWASRVEYNQATDQYEINNVLGPDEYSEHVNNNLYTNMLVKWQLRKSIALVKHLQGEKNELWQKLKEKISFNLEELERWDEIINKLVINYDPERNLYIQHDDFLTDDNIDDKIAEAKRKDLPLPELVSWEQVNQSQALKQPDVVMLQYLLSDEFNLAEKRAAWDLYEPKTMHDSSLSPAIHAIMASEMGDVAKAYQYFKQGAEIDLSLGGSEAGLHAASLGGLWQSVVNGFAGLRIGCEKVSLNPNLPKGWSALSFKLSWQGEEIAIDLTKEQLELELVSKGERDVEVEVAGSRYDLTPGEKIRINN